MPRRPVLPQQQAPAKDYASDSGVSEAGTTQSAMPRSMTKQNKADMRGSTELYTESRPSILSADRIGFTQHSGKICISSYDYSLKGCNDLAELKPIPSKSVPTAQESRSNNC